MAGVTYFTLRYILCAIKINFVCSGEKFWPLEPITIYTQEVVTEFILRVFALQGVFKEQIKLVNQGITILLLHVEKGITPLDWQCAAGSDK